MTKETADTRMKVDEVDLPDRLRAIVRFLPKFETPGFEFGHWEHPQPERPGVIAMPYYLLGDVANSFIKAAYEFRWVMTGFDWPLWMRTPEAESLRDDPDALNQAAVEQLARLLTVCIRQERFVDGALEAAFSSGLLTGILKRAVAILGSIEFAPET